MWEIAVAFIISMPPVDAQVSAGPVISCIDGHIVTNIGDCPPVVKHDIGGPGGSGGAPIGGGGGRRGLLGLGGLLGIL